MSGAITILLFMIIAYIIFNKVDSQRKDFFSKFEEKQKERQENLEKEPNIVSLSGTLKAKKSNSSSETSELKIPESIIEKSDFSSKETLELTDYRLLSEEELVVKIGDRTFFQMIFNLEDNVEMLTSAIGDINNRLDVIEEKIEHLDESSDIDQELKQSMFNSEVENLQKDMAEASYKIIRLEAFVRSHRGLDSQC